MATDAEVAAKKKKIKELRSKVRVENAKVSKGITEGDNQIKMARLDAEEARLNSELKAIQEVGSAKAQKDSIKEQIKSAPETPVLDAALAADENADKENK